MFSCLQYCIQSTNRLIKELKRDVGDYIYQAVKDQAIRRGWFERLNATVSQKYMNVLRYLALLILLKQRKTKVGGMTGVDILKTCQ